jgi:tight adherence protein B
MDPVIYLFVFLILSILLIAPYVIFMQLHDKLKRQALEERIRIINKQSSALRGERKIAIKQQKKNLRTRLTPIQIMFLVIMPIPALFILLFSHNFYSAMTSVIIYFSVIIVIYVLTIGIRKRRYHKAFVTELPNSIDLIIRSLRAGRTIVDSIKIVGEETEGPVAVQFKSIVDQVEMGKEFVVVANDISNKIKIPEFSFFVIVLSVQQETGGNIIKTLSSLSNMLRQRQLMRMKVKALSSEGIFSAFFMGGLPFLVAGLIELIRPEYILLLFTNSTGQHLLIAGIISEIIGCIVIARMVRVDI